MLNLRRATQEDCQAICVLHRRAIREVCARAYSAEQIEAWAGLLSPDRYEAVIRERWVRVAEVADGLVGFGQLDLSSGEVEAVYVSPDRQGEGIGGALLASLEGAAREAGLQALFLSATLNAASFYARAGYREERAALHRLPTGLALACIRMAKALPSS